MGGPELLQIDPVILRLPGSRRDGADPAKLHRQIARFGNSIDGMPPIEVQQGTDGEFVIFNRVTRGTRAARLLPGTPVTVEVTGKLSGPVSALPTVGDRLLFQTRKFAMI